MPLPPTLPLPGGLALPSVGLGTFRLRDAAASSAVAAALEAGYRHIDTATVYKNEGDVAAGIAASGVPRREMFVTSKVSPYQQGEAAATAACEASLAALGSPIDLMLIHWPGVARQDAASPGNADARRQTWRVLERYHRRGAFRAIGVSNYEVRHIEELLSYAEVAPAVNQVECHPRWQQRELRAFCSAHGIAVVAYCSLGSGELLHDNAVQAVAASAGVTPAQALLLWGLRRGCAVIPKSADARRIADVAPARLAQRWDALGEEHLAALDALEAEQGRRKFAWDPAGIA